MTFLNHAPSVSRGTNHEQRLAQRILSALKHPNCPSSLFDFEAEKLARHIAVRMVRNKGEDSDD